MFGKDPSVQRAKPEEPKPKQASNKSNEGTKGKRKRNMSAMLNFIGLLTLMSMSAVLLSGAGVPVGAIAHAAIGYLQGFLPVQLP